MEIEVDDGRGGIMTILYYPYFPNCSQIDRYEKLMYVGKLPFCETKYVVVEYDEKKGIRTSRVDSNKGFINETKF